MYVSGADPENPALSDHSYTSYVPANYGSVNVSVGFGSEFTCALVQNGNRTTLRSGERRTVSLNEGGGTTTEIVIELSGPANGGDNDSFTLYIIKRNE